MTRLHDGLDEWAQNREHGFYPHPLNGREGTVLLRLSAARLRSLERWAFMRRFVRWALPKLHALQAWSSTHSPERDSVEATS